MAGEPVGFLAVLLLVTGLVFEIQHLDLDAAPGQLSRFEPREGGIGSPEKNARVAGRFHVSPFGDQFKVLVGLLRPRHADWLSGAVDRAVLFLPGVLVAVDVLEVGQGKRLPPGSLTVDERLPRGRLCLGFCRAIRFFVIGQQESRNQYQDNGTDGEAGLHRMSLLGDLKNSSCECGLS